jgi:hypothetical protein
MAGMIPDVEMMKPIADAVHDVPVRHEVQVWVPLDAELPEARTAMFNPAAIGNSATGNTYSCQSVIP